MESCGKRSLNVAVAPGFCGKYIQASDVCINKRFKECITKKYDEWLATGKHEFTDGGNTKPAPRKTVVQWIIEVQKEGKRKMVADSIKGCTVTTKWHGSEDEKPHALKK